MRDATHLEVDVRCVAHASLDWQAMHAVLGAEGDDVLDLALVVLDGELDAQDVLYRSKSSTERARAKSVNAPSCCVQHADTTPLVAATYLARLETLDDVRRQVGERRSLGEELLEALEELGLVGRSVRVATRHGDDRRRRLAHEAHSRHDHGAEGAGAENTGEHGGGAGERARRR